MNIYDIKTKVIGQINSVVADNMAEAERIFMAKYWPATIIEITLHSEYVQIQKHDEQPRNSEV